MIDTNTQTAAASDATSAIRQTLDRLLAPQIEIAQTAAQELKALLVAGTMQQRKLFFQQLNEKVAEIEFADQIVPEQKRQHFFTLAQFVQNTANGFESKRHGFKQYRNETLRIAESVTQANKWLVMIVSKHDITDSVIAGMPRDIADDAYVVLGDDGVQQRVCDKYADSIAEDETALTQFMKYKEFLDISPPHSRFASNIPS